MTKEQIDKLKSSIESGLRVFINPIDNDLFEIKRIYKYKRYIAESDIDINYIYADVHFNENKEQTYVYLNEFMIDQFFIVKPMFESL